MVEPLNFGVLTAAATGCYHGPEAQVKKSDIPVLKPLGGTGLTTGGLSLGCGTFGREIDQDASFATMDRAMELGFRLFDTAETYGGGESRIYRKTFYGVDDTREVSHEMHSSEKIIGRWLRSRGVRPDVILVTKVWENYTPAHLMEAIR